MRRKPLAGTQRRSLITKRMSGPLAIDASALSIYWEWGIGCDNKQVGQSTVVTIDGPLARESCWTDGYDAILDRFKQACSDTETSSVILRMSSPGGEVSGLFECVDQMRAVAKKSGKRIVAISDDHAHSAAYALACVASEIYLSRTSSVGSVGVLCVVGDCVAMNERIGLNIVVIHAGDRKVDGHPDVPLSDDAISVFQSQVVLFAEMFWELVADGRGMSTEDVSALQAGTFIGDQGVDAGLADGVMSFDQVVAMIASDAQQSTAADSGNKEEDEAMGAKKTGHKTNAEAGVTDAYSAAMVAPVNMAALAAIASGLAAGQPGVAATQAAPKPRADKSDKPDKDDSDDDDADAAGDNEEEKTAKDDSDDDDDEADDEADSDSDDDSDDDDSDDDDDDDDKKDKKDKKDAAARRAPIAAGSTSADVLKAVREMTGEGSPAAQIGALLGMRDKADSADRAARRNARMKREVQRAEKTTLIKSAVASGKLAPSQKEWAKSCTLGSLKAYLKSAPKALVKRKSTAHGTAPRAAAATDLDDAVAKVAAACQVDPKALAQHAADLRTKGLLQ